MPLILTSKKSTPDLTWGCEHTEVLADPALPKIVLCYVAVKDVGKISEKLTESVLDTSWMSKLDKGGQLAYRVTAQQTANALATIFKKAQGAPGIGSEFGEVMVSMGAGRALEQLFQHAILPIAELWKPQIKQNEGFDFHTVCSQQLINFGEAKYSGKVNPHGKAIKQIKDFIDEEKYFRDQPHLVKFVPDKAHENLLSDQFGVVAAFSINSNDRLKIIGEALASVKKKLPLSKLSAVYVVGVCNEN